MVSTLDSLKLLLLRLTEAPTLSFMKEEKSRL